MSDKLSPLKKLKEAVKQAAVGSMDPLTHLLAVALDDDEIATEIEKRVTGKMIGSARLISVEGDLQAGISGTIEIPIFSEDVGDLLKEPIYVFTDLSTRKAHIVSRPVQDQPSQPRMANTPYVMSSQPGLNTQVVSLGPEAIARENAYFGRIGLTPRLPFNPTTLPERPDLEMLINEIISRREWGGRAAAAAQSTCTYDTTSSCVTFTAPGMNYDQRVQDDCQGDGYRTDD